MTAGAGVTNLYSNTGDSLGQRQPSYRRIYRVSVRHKTLACLSNKLGNRLVMSRCRQRRRDGCGFARAGSFAWVGHSSI